MNRTKSLRRLLPLGMSAAVLFGLCMNAQAAHIYTIQQTQSQLNLTVAGSAFGGALTVTEQQPTAITRYNGTIVADFPGGPGPNGAISFPGGGNANAVNPTGLFSIPLQYSPNVNGGAGTAPANYGVNLSAPLTIAIPPFEIPGVGTLSLGNLEAVDIKMAIRDLQLDVDSGSIPINLSSEFDASQVALSINAGSADVNGSLRLKQPDIISHLAAVVAINALVATLPDLGLTVSSNLLQRTINLGFGTRLDLATVGNLGLPNAPATPGTVSYSLPSGSSTLTIPVLASLSAIDLGLTPDILDLQLSLAGQLRATAIVPEPSTIVLLVTGTIGLFGIARRRRK